MRTETIVSEDAQQLNLENGATHDKTSTLTSRFSTSSRCDITTVLLLYNKNSDVRSIGILSFVVFMYKFIPMVHT